MKWRVIYRNPLPHGQGLKHLAKTFNSRKQAESVLKDLETVGFVRVGVEPSEPSRKTGSGGSG